MNNDSIAAWVVSASSRRTSDDSHRPFPIIDGRDSPRAAVSDPPRCARANSMTAVGGQLGRDSAPQCG